MNHAIQMTDEVYLKLLPLECADTTVIIIQSRCGTFPSTQK